MVLIEDPAPKAPKPTELQKAAAGAFAAFTLATAGLNVPAAVASDFSIAPFSSSQVVAETVTRQGVYKEYDVEVSEQKYDDARSTFKDAKETKSKKGKVGIL